MAYWALFFLLISLLAGLFGFWEFAAGAAGIAKILLAIFVSLFVVTLLASLLRSRPPRH
jgi:uncharacterized membrane protein YtjA (UPF0391 family)